MLIIPVKDGENIDRALKRFKRKFDKTGTMRQLRDRQQFTKPSVKRRKQVQKAQYIQGLRDAEEIQYSVLIIYKSAGAANVSADFFMLSILIYCNFNLELLTF